MFELIIALLLASSCPSPKTVNNHSQLVRLPISVVDTAGDHGHIRPDIFGRKYLPIRRTLVALEDTAGDHGHIRPDIFGHKRVLRA